jgi:cytochrome P450
MYGRWGGGSTAALWYVAGLAAAAAPFAAAAAALPLAALPPAVALLSLLWLFRYLVVTPLWLMRHYRRQGLRGTSWTPVLGDPVRMAEMLSTTDGFESDIASIHALGPVAYCFFGPELHLRLWDLSLVQQVLLRESAAFAKPVAIKRVLWPLLGSDNLALSEGATHAHHRTVISPSFTFSRLRGMVPFMADAASAAVSRWLEAAAASPDVPVDLHREVSCLSLTIIGGAAFGAELSAPLAGSSDEDAHATLADMAAGACKALQTMDAVFLLRAYVPGFNRLPSVASTTVGKASARLRRALQELMRRRRALRACRSHAVEIDRCAFLLDFLLDAQEHAEPGTTATVDSGAADPSSTPTRHTPLTDEEVMSECLTFMLGGHESTTHAVTWAVVLLAQHADVAA